MPHEIIDSKRAASLNWTLAPTLAEPPPSEGHTTTAPVDDPPRERALHARRARHLRFVRRVYHLRTIGLGFGAMAVASVLLLRHAPTALWILLAFDGLVWPHAAALIALHSDDPRRAEMRNLMIDSAFGGVWIAVMQFNVLPSVLLLTMLSVDKISVGGFPLVTRTSIALLCGCAIVSAALGFAFDPATPMSVIVGCVPFLFVYPMAVNNVTYGLAKRVRQQNRRLEELGRTDGLTGLANRGEGLDVAARELERHARSGKPVTLMIADIDLFKPINDSYGHPQGDSILCRVAETLERCCRGGDTTARYGGDEFLLVLPDTTLAGAADLARRIGKMLDAHSSDVRCTLSIGAAEAEPRIRTVDEWISAADAALYRAKLAGRNRFEAARPRA